MTGASFHWSRCEAPLRRDLQICDSFRASLAPLRDRNFETSSNGCGEKQIRYVKEVFSWEKNQAILLADTQCSIDLILPPRSGQRCWMCGSGHYRFQWTCCRLCLTWWCLHFVISKYSARSGTGICETRSKTMKRTVWRKMTEMKGK